MKLLRAAPMVLVTALSVLLLVYVGYGEGQRVYERFQLRAFLAEAELVQGLMEDFLREGLPLAFIRGFLDEKLKMGRFAGFSSLLDGRDQRTLTIVDAAGAKVYSSFEGEIPRAGPEGTPIEVLSHQLIRDDGQYQLSLPLRDKYAQVGEMIATMPVTEVARTVDRAFLGLRYYAAVLIVAFAVLAHLLIGKGGKRGRARLRYAFGAVFFVLAIVIVVQLIEVYRGGAEARTRALAGSLAQRLKVISETGVSLEEFPGLESLLEEFQEENPDISVVALVHGETLAMLSGGERGGDERRSLQVRRGDTEQIVPIDDEGLRRLMIVMPAEVLRNRVLRSIKNFAALFVACGFLSFLFFDVASAFQTVQKLVKDRASGERSGMIGLTLSGFLTKDQGLWLTLMQAIWFLAVFVEGLNASFLPHFLQQVTAGAQLPPLLGGVLFSSFFAAFVAVLIPASRYAEKGEVKNLLLGGALLIAASLLLLSLTESVYLLLVSRLLSGAGQGIAFVGVQSYLIVVTVFGNRTQGSAKQVLAQNSGVISGAAIGALVVVYLQPASIFLAGSVISAVNVFLIAWLVPKVGSKSRVEEPAQAPGGLRERLRVVFGDFEFFRTFLLVGSASKVVYNGVVFFAIPILMRHQGYAQEDIGQALMLFAGSVLVANHYVAGLADRKGALSRILFVGMVASGLGAISVGLTDWLSGPSLPFAWLDQLALFGGILILGLANGVVAAPVVSHVLETRAARTLGRSSAVAIYRLLERTGHVVGPLLVGQALILSGNHSMALVVTGAVIVFCGLAFFAFHRPASG